MKFLQQLKSIFEKKGLVQKAKDGKMTDAEWATVRAAYKEEYGTDLDQDNAAYQQTLQDAALGRSVASMLAQPEQSANTAAADGAQTEGAAQAAEGVDANDGASNPPAAQAQSANTVQPDNAAILQQLATILQTNRTLENQVSAMQNRATPDVPAGNAVMTLVVSGPGTNATHLYGIDHPMFSLKNRWNQVAANPAFAIANSQVSKETETAFRSAVENFGESLSQRFQTLHANGQLHPETLKSLTFTTSDLSQAGLGAQYVVRRQDALIARLLEIPSVAGLFNTRYNVQDRELITNAFFSELSQAFQTGNIFKGGMSLQPEIGHVDDLMIKIQFTSMKEIERLYIGYLNTSGSDPIKWSMIEFTVMGLMKQALNEYNERKIMGIYVKPETGKAGSYMTAGTGLIYTLIRYQKEHKLLPHDDDDFASYTNATMLSVVKAFLAQVLEDVTKVGGNLNGFAINLNANHRPWWISCIRTAYGKETDFTGPTSYANMVPDTEVPIRWIPNMKQHCFMWLEQPGNLQFLENVPGEIYALKVQEFMEQVMMWSNGKEGTTAAFVGKKFATLAALKANLYAMQQIFINKPMTLLTADATTCDATKGFWFGTITNIGATAPDITNITGAQKGVAYIIECTSVTKASTVTKALKFASLTDDYAPTAVGDYLMVILNTDGDGFLELERCVGGVRTINTATQPNIPGAR